MARNFLRDYRLTIQGTGEELSIKGLRVVFGITHDLFGYPQQAKFDIYNLSRDRINQIQDEFQGIYFAAGYAGDVKQIFNGQIRNVVHTKRGTETVTEIYAGNAERALKEAFSVHSFEPGTDLETIIYTITGDMQGVTIANLDGINRKITSDRTFSGPSRKVLDALSSEFEFWWSVIDGQLYTFGKEGALTEEDTLLINKNTGMIDSPSVTEIGANVKILLNPNATPFKIIQIESATPNISLGDLNFRKVNKTMGAGLYRINKVVHSGDTRSSEWFSTITGKDFIE